MTALSSDGVAFVSTALMLPKRPALWQRSKKILKQYMPLVAKMKEYDEDRYGRLIVELFTEDNKSINAAMICSGAAWWYEYFPIGLNSNNVGKMLRKTSAAYGLRKTL